jgi:hypothetical protein
MKNCCICDQEKLGTVYYLDFGGVCIKCEGYVRDNPIKIPYHIPDEQHVEYKIKYLRRIIERAR